MPQDSASTETQRHYPPWVESVVSRLRLLKVGSEFVYRPVTSSTNDDTRNLALEGAPDGLVVLADEQSHGRGRLGRAWLAPPETCLLLSVLFRRSIPVEQAGQLTMLMGLAALDAIREVAGLEAELKWPNDLMLSGRKVGGILSEVQLSGSRLRWAVVGLGLNVNADLSGYPEIADSAISLKDVVGREVDRGALLLVLMRALSVRYTHFLGGEPPVDEWQSHLSTLGREVTVQACRESFQGLAEFVTAEGSLFVRLADGTRREVLAGDVKLRETVK